MVDCDLRRGFVEVVSSPERLGFVFLCLQGDLKKLEQSKTELEEQLQELSEDAEVRAAEAAETKHNLEAQLETTKKQLKAAKVCLLLFFHPKNCLVLAECASVCSSSLKAGTAFSLCLGLCRHHRCCCPVDSYFACV